MYLVRDIMQYNIGAVPQDLSLREAAEIMKMRDTGQLPVGDGGRMIGIISDRDIALGVAVDRLDPNTTPIGVIMAESVVAIYDDRDLLEAANLMEYNKVQRLVVLDRTTRAMLGVVTMGDIAEKADPEELIGGLPGGVPPPDDPVE